MRHPPFKGCQNAWGITNFSAPAAGRRPSVPLFPGFSSLFVDFQKKNLRIKNVKYRQNTISISRLGPVSEKNNGASEAKSGKFSGLSRNVKPRKFITLGILRYLSFTRHGIFHGNLNLIPYLTPPAPPFSILKNRFLTIFISISLKLYSDTAVLYSDTAVL